jgi:Domain of unknown function (DUF4349)
MEFNARWVAGLAAIIFAALFVLRFLSLAAPPPNDFGFDGGGQANSVFEGSRKNYASSKKLEATTGGEAIGNSQKYEKIGSLTQVSQDYEADRKKTDDLIAANKGMVQLERATGLKGRRLLHLGIGVPPERFDAFIEAVRGVGKAVAIEIVKNDKTNEYLQLRAKRATLEKARTALEDLKAGGGSIDERVNVQTKLTDIEQQIQELGVSLGDFDSQNELCTVKLTLREAAKATELSVAWRALRALELALFDYLMLGLGFFGLMAAAWIAVQVLVQVRKLVAIANGS